MALEIHPFICIIFTCTEIHFRDSYETRVDNVWFITCSVVLLSWDHHLEFTIFLLGIKCIEFKFS